MGNAHTKKELEYLQELSSQAQSEAFDIQPREVEHLLTCLQSSKPRLQEWSANTISWLTKSNATNRKTLAENGAIKFLTARLKSKDSKIQCWAVCAIGNLCIDNEENKNTVLELKGITYIIKLLKSRNAKVQRWAANAIGILCMDNQKGKDIFQKEGGIPDLVNVLLSAQTHGVRKWTVFALGNLIDMAETKKLLIQKNAFKPMVQLLESLKKDDESKRWAANVIGNLCAEDPEARVLAAKAGVVRPLIIHLRDSRDPNVVRNAAFSLGNVCFDNPANRQKAKELGGLKMLINMLQMRKNTDKKMENAVAVAIISIMEGDDDIPMKLKSLLDQVRAGTVGDDVGSKLIDLVDESHTVAMRLTKRPPKLEAIFKTEENLENCLKDSAPSSTINQSQIKTSQSKIKSSSIIDSKGKGKDINKEKENENENENSNESDNENENENENDKGRKGKDSPLAISKERTNSFDRSDKSDKSESGDGNEDEESEEDNSGRSSMSYLDQLKGDVEYDSLEIIDEIGSGSFGTVYKAQHKGDIVAVKEMYFSDNEHIQRLIVREVQTLKTLSHPNILRYMGFCIHVTGTYLVTEFVDGGDLRTHLKTTSEELSWPIRISIARDIASAMTYVHEKGIIHRDIKSKNVLLKSNYSAVLCDFGFARESTMPKGPTSMTLKVGTNEWMAPEIVMGQDYAQPADMFSYGMFLVELLTRQKPPIDRKNIYREDMFKAYIKSKLMPQGDTHPLIQPFTNLAFKCVAKSAANRPTFAQVEQLLAQMQASASS